MSRLNGKIALVTGGGTGIGKAIVEAFVAEGAKVVITGRREAPLKALASAHPDAIAYVTADVAKPGDPKRALEFTQETFGKLDILVNNAGTFNGKPLVETTDEEIALLTSVNFNGLVSTTREAIPFLLETKGSVLNVSSVAGKGVWGAAVYSATKAAVDQLTRVLAAELGPQGIRVNVVAPGMTETDMATDLLQVDEVVQGTVAQTPLRRIGRPEDIAGAALFLASDDASWVTGQLLQASGGLLL